MDRPTFCTIEDCQVIHNNFDHSRLKRGGSCFCCGRNSQVIVWQAGETIHPNDINFCIYTPFKGWIRFLMCEPDIEILSCMAWAIAKFTGKKIRLYGPDRVGYL